MRQTKQEMVKDIFFTATDGIRSTKNYPEGMWVIEMIAKNNRKDTIADLWQELDERANTGASRLDLYSTSRRLLAKLVDWTYINTSGVNGYTKTSLGFIQAANKFI